MYTRVRVFDQEEHPIISKLFDGEVARNLVVVSAATEFHGKLYQSDVPCTIHVAQGYCYVIETLEEVPQ